MRISALSRTVAWTCFAALSLMLSVATASPLPTESYSPRVEHVTYHWYGTSGMSNLAQALTATNCRAKDVGHFPMCWEQAVTTLAGCPGWINFSYTGVTPTQAAGVDDGGDMTAGISFHFSSQVVDGSSCRSVWGQSYVNVARNAYCPAGWTQTGNMCREPCPAGFPTWDAAKGICVGSATSNPPSAPVRGDTSAPPAPSGQCPGASPTPTRGGCSDQRASGSNVVVGDPIHLGSGNVFHREVDVSLPGGGLTFERYFNSLSTEKGVLANWTADHVYWQPNGSAMGMAEISYAGTGIQTATAKLRLPDGKIVRFTAQYYSSTGRFVSAWSSANAYPYTLATEQGTSGGWTALLLADGTGTTYRLKRYASTVAYLEKVSDTRGVLLTYTRTSGLRLTSVQDRFGNSLGFTYNASNRLTGLTVNGQVHATYTYDATGGKLVAVSYADGSSRQYLYQDANYPSALSAIVDERGVVTASWRYDNYGRGIESKLGDGHTVTVSYNADGTVTETLENGLVNRYWLSVINGIPLTTEKRRTLDGIDTSFLSEYDTSGNLTRTVDWRGVVSTYTYDGQRRETRRTLAAGTPEARTVQTEWHPTLRLPTRVVTATRETISAYDGNQRVSMTQTDLTSWGAGSRTWTYTYLASGLLQAIDGPLPGNADVVTYAYDAMGRLASVTNALGHVTTVLSHTALGMPLEVVDPNGVVTRFADDLRGRVRTVTLVDPVEGDLVTTYDYDAAGHVTGVTQPDGTSVAMEYDAVGELLAITDATGARLEYERDAEGNVLRIHTRHANGALVRRIEQAWDPLRRLTAVFGAQGLVAGYTYDQAGNRVASVDGLNHPTAHAFDALDRLVESVDAVNAATTFAYDAAGHLAGVTDARGLTTTYEYDGLGCLRRLTSPDTGVTAFTCDMAGNVTSKTDARGVTVNYGYDALGRRTSAWYPGAPTETAFFGYDGTAGGNYGIGRLTAIQNDGADIALRYDARGNVVEDRRVIGGQLYVTGYAWDRAGRLAAITYPSGRVVSYQRDASGAVAAVTTQAPGGPVETVASNITWQPFGPLGSLTHGNGLVETRSHDIDGNLAALSVGTLLSRTYSRDAAGRITAIVDADPAASEAYAYNAVDRLTSASGPFGTRAYTYDGVGNRVTADSDGNASAYAYGSTSNRLYQVTGFDAAALDYDAAGNTATKNNLSFAYNAANRLVQVTVAGAGGPETTSFAYSGQGERVRKAGVPGVTHFHYGLDGQLLAETDGDGAVVREYLWLGDQPVALVSRRNVGEAFELFAVHNDHLATALALTDSTQAVVWQYRREPFGKLVVGSNTVRWPLRFPGQYEDAETGLFYNYYRDYDPQTGRYIESDPIGLYGGINIYAYVRNSPLSLMDANGLEPKRSDSSTCGKGMRNCDDAVDSFNQSQGLPKKGAKPREKKQINDVCNEKQIDDRDGFGDYIERYKEGRGIPRNGTLPYQKLRELADEFNSL